MDALQGAIDVDTNIFFSINRMHNMYFDYFMSAYSGKWVWIPMYAAIWYVMLRNFHWKVTLFCMIGLALTITFADQACATWIRPYVERMRPSNLNNPISEMVHIVNNHRGGRYGFPSCHAANTFGLAFFGVHYPGDLLAGTIVGLIGAWLIYRLFVKVSGYKRVEHVTHVYAPIWVGLLTIAGMLVYAGIRILL